MSKGKMKNADDVLTSWLLTLNMLDSIRMKYRKEINCRVIDRKPTVIE